MGRLRHFGLCVVLASASCLSATAIAAQEVSLNVTRGPDDLADRLRSNSLLIRATNEEEAPTTQDVIAAAQADYGRLIGVLYEEGYFAPVITITLDGVNASETSPFDLPDAINAAVITVNPGQRFRFGRADIGPQAEDTVLPERFRRGSRVTTPLLRETTEAALEAWRVRGYPLAAVVGQEITARNRDARLDVAIALDSGPQLTFGQTEAQGNERVRASRVAEIAGLPVGELYAPSEIARAEERLRDTGSFSAVSLQLAEPNADGSIDVNAVVDEAPLRRIGFGAEVASDEGIRLSTFWIHRNVRGGAERLRLDGEISGIRDGETDPDFLAGATYRRPATLHPDNTMELSFQGEILNQETFSSQGLETAIIMERWISEQLTVTGGVGLSFTRVEDGFGTRNSVRLTTPTTAVFDNRDNPLDPAAGAYVAATLTPFFPYDANPGVRSTADLRSYIGLTESRRTRLAGRVQVGSVVGAEIEDVLPDDLFFSGGAGTVRGQAFQSIGSVRDSNEAGGRSFFGASAELRQTFGDSNFGAVAFVDYGRVTAESFLGGEAASHWGGGLGFRFSTPFGPIRLDVGTPLGEEAFGDEFFLYIGIGQAF